MTRARELAELATSYDSGSSMGFRNRIINGDMRIDQRNNGASVTINSPANTYVVDRWRANANGGGAFSLKRSTVAPAGFTNSLLATVTTVDASVVPGDFYHVRQTIEGFNFSDLGFGSAAAQTTTVSFWTRNSLTGTFTVLLRNEAASRGYVTTYTVNSANTWEYKTITIPGDTTGTWATDNSGSCIVSFGLGGGNTQTPNVWTTTTGEAVTGMTQWISTNGATFYITGVQLEAGTVATPFERRDYGRELMMCQRYYETGSTYNLYSGYVVTGEVYYNPVRFAVTKRAAPLVTPTYVATSRFAASAPAAQAVSADGLWFSATATLTGTGYFQYTWVASVEL